MNNIQMKNEVPNNEDQTVKLIFGVTFADGTAIDNGTVVISRAEWLEYNGKQKLDKIAEIVSKNMLSTKTGE